MLKFARVHKYWLSMLFCCCFSRSRPKGSTEKWKWIPWLDLPQYKQLPCNSDYLAPLLSSTLDIPDLACLKLHQGHNRRWLIDKFHYTCTPLRNNLRSLSPVKANSLRICSYIRRARATPSMWPPSGYRHSNLKTSCRSWLPLLKSQKVCKGCLSQVMFVLFY